MVELLCSFLLLAVASTLLVKLVSSQQRLHQANERRLADQLKVENLAERFRHETFNSLSEVVEATRKTAADNGCTLVIESFESERSDQGKPVKGLHLQITASDDDSKADVSSARESNTDRAVTHRWYIESPAEMPVKDNSEADIEDEAKEEAPNESAETGTSPQRRDRYWLGHDKELRFRPSEDGARLICDIRSVAPGEQSFVIEGSLNPSKVELKETQP